MQLRSTLARPAGPLLLAAAVSAGPTSAALIRAPEKRKG